MFIINTVFQWYGSDCGFRKYQYLPQGLLFGLYPLPPGISSLASYFPFKIWLLRPAQSSEFSMAILGVGTDIFQSCTFYFLNAEMKLFKVDLHLFKVKFA